MMIAKLDNVNKFYGEKKVIENFSYCFDKGKMYAIIGKSGSGKTTLLNIIGLLDKPTSGNVIVGDGKNINPKSSSATHMRRNYISYLFQNYALCPNESIEYNLKMALNFTENRNNKEMMQDALKRVGLDISLKNKVYQLSGGEQQRVALARLILKPSQLILADEPTGNLDSMNAKLVFDILDELKKDEKTVIIVTHDEDIAALCDEIIRLS